MTHQTTETSALHDRPPAFQQGNQYNLERPPGTCRTTDDRQYHPELIRLHSQTFNKHRCPNVQMYIKLIFDVAANLQDSYMTTQMHQTAHKRTIMHNFTLTCVFTQLMRLLPCPRLDINE